MVENNSFFVDLFAPIKPEFITFHIEEEKHPHRLVQKIKDYGIKAGMVLNPHSSPELIRYLLPELDIVLLMSVNPGFGGQKFLPSVIKKSSELADMRAKYGSKCIIEVDGGVNDKNIYDLKNAGVDMVVAGNFVFKSNNYAEAIKALKI
jgi:ribulose-phosphate 3-epimerase